MRLNQSASDAQTLPEVVHRFIQNLSIGDWGSVAETYADAPRSFAFFDDDLQKLLAWQDAAYVASNALGIARYVGVLRAHLSPTSSELLSAGRSGNAVFAVYRWNARVRTTAQIITIVSNCVWYLNEDDSRIIDGVVTNRRIESVPSPRSH